MYNPENNFDFMSLSIHIIGIIFKLNRPS